MIWVVLFFVVFLFILFMRTAIVVPQQSAYIVERLGRYSKTLDAGFHILVPFVETIRYRHTLKEQAVDIPEQECITRDNVMVGVDGILYLKVLDPERAIGGVMDPARHRVAVLRSVGQRAQDQCVERALHQHQIIGAHWSLPGNVPGSIVHRRGAVLSPAAQVLIEIATRHIQSVAEPM